MSSLIYEKKGRIACITLNRPDKMNSLNTELLDKLAEAWKEFRDDDNLWVAVLTGAGKAFCVGADLQSIGEPGIQIGFNVLREDPNQYALWKPVIAALNGHVIGRGISLALACDIRIASEKVQFSIPEARFGVIPGDVDVLERFISPGITRELLFTGDRISAQRAYEIGLVNKVVPPEELMDRSMELAEKIAANSPIAVQGIKEMLGRSKDLNYRSAVAIYEKVNSRVLGSSDFKEGMQSISEKRAPKWEGK